MAIKGILPQIKHFVVLMLENRSLDAVCGWLYEGDKPNRVIGRDLGRPYDGLEEGKYWNELKENGAIKRYPIVKTPPGDLRLPQLNPDEEYIAVNNQLYGDAETSYRRTPPFGTPARMTGFLQDHSRQNPREPWEVLQCYGPRDLPALNGLAKHYAISDRWFSSVPTQTNPNRAFFHCGTSLGREKNERLTAVETYNIPTFWNALSQRRVEWTTYFHDNWPLFTGSSKSYTEYTFPATSTLRNPTNRRTFAPIADFFTDARAGGLPPFTFLEPKWSFGVGGIVRTGNDYHPPAGLNDAEAFVKKVYEALASHRKAWSETLLVITFDEHGGTYDHVAPPWTAVRPDGRIGINGFKFDRYGVRVPTLLISPFVPEKTVFRSKGELEYDHTSLTATILKWQGIDPASAGLRDRVKTAPTFEDVLTDFPRPDVPGIDLPAVASTEAVTLEEAEWSRRYEALPPPVGKALAEIAKDEEDLKRRIEAYERAGRLREDGELEPGL